MGHIQKMQQQADIDQLLTV